ncbi:methenyltetrahydrofolate cyclohydrolase [Aureococcus anophagefferens]|nr:methenyltetrahydrofolate cyclohydrolase [Aureococcus anophagefferens]
MRWRPTVLAAAALGGRALLTAAMAAVQGVNILDGAATAKAIRAELGSDVDALRAAHGVTPGLGVVLVGERRDSQTYVRMKQKVAAEIGVHCLPLPAHVDEGRVLGAIDFRKDADGFSETNAGCVELLRRHGVALAGKRAVVLGRSNIVGMPVAALLQACDATVTVCHSATPDVAAIVRDADVVVAAVGRARYVEASWLKPGCVVAAKDVASLITPVPGGVGPMTIAMLMSNVVNLTKASLGVETAPLPGRLGDAETTTRLSGLPKEDP